MFRNLLNYITNGAGFTTFASYSLRRSFARVGLTYSYSGQTVTPLIPGARPTSSTSISKVSAVQTALSGIRTSTITPTYAYNTVNHPIIPTHGLRVNASFGFTGGALGGNVNTITPSLDMAYFRKGIFRNNVMGFHVNARFISGYGGKVAPPYSRFYMGGEDDIRGFDLWTISPIAFLPTVPALVF